MKKNFLSKIKNAILGFTFIVAAFTVAGCKTNIDDNKAVYNDGKAHLKIELDSSDARTIFPSIQKEELTAISLSYKEAGDGEIVFGIWDDYESFSKADVALDAGARYTFELNAYKNGTKLTSDKVNLTLIKGENPIAFNLHISDTGSDNGTIEIKATFGADVELASASAALLKAENFEQYYEISNLLPYVKSAENGSKYISFTKNDVQVAEDTFGKYWIEMNFTTTDGKIAQIGDYIWVTSGCVSGDTYNLDEMWADKLALASALYNNRNTHIYAEPDPDGNGVKFTLNFQDDDKMWLQYSIFEEESELAISTRTCWTESNLPSKENKTVEIVYPFTENNKKYVFEFRLWPSKKWVSTSDEGYADAIAVPGYSVWDDGCDYITEKVIVTANGGNVEIINPRASNVLKEAKLELSATDATMHLTEDIKSYFVKTKLHAEYDSLVNVNVHNGKIDWSDDCGTYGFEISADDYDLLIDANEDGSVYEITNETILNALTFKNDRAKTNEKVLNDCWWASTFIEFHAKDSDVWFVTPEIVSEETPYTNVPRNTYSFEYPQYGMSYCNFEKLYKTGKTATLPDALNLDTSRFKFLGWYENSDFTGTPVTSITAANNNGDKTFYGKINMLFRLNQWSPNDYNFDITNNIGEILGAANEDISEGDTVKFTVTGVATTDFDGIWHTILAEYTPAFEWTSYGNSAYETVHIKAGEEFSQEFYIRAEHDIAKENSIIELVMDETEWDSKTVLMEFEEYTTEVELDVEVSTLLYQGTMFNEGMWKEVVYPVGTEVTLENPTDIENMKFVGWYDNTDNTLWNRNYEIPDGVEPITTIKLDSDKAVIAKWDLVMEQYSYDDVETFETRYHSSVTRNLPKWTSAITELHTGDILSVSIKGTPNVSHENVGVQLFNTYNGHEIFINSFPGVNFVADERFDEVFYFNIPWTEESLANNINNIVLKIVVDDGNTPGSEIELTNWSVNVNIVDLSTVTFQRDQIGNPGADFSLMNASNFSELEKFEVGQTVTARITGTPNFDYENSDCFIRLVDRSEAAGYWLPLSAEAVSLGNFVCTEEDGFELEVTFTIQADQAGNMSDVKLNFITPTYEGYAGSAGNDLVITDWTLELTVTDPAN